MTLIQGNDFLDNISSYKPGKSSKDLGNKSLIKLSSNENPFGAAIDQVQFTSYYKNIERYANTTDNELINALGKHHNITTDSIILGNGSDELFQFISQCFLNPDSEAISSDHTFSVYKSCVQVVGARYISVKMTDFRYNLDLILNKITSHTKVIFIANPNNPTGTFLTMSEIKHFLNSVPNHVLVVLDEAYKDYVQDEERDLTLTLLSEFKNVIITRTFSKMYGLAGLRLGYGVAHPGIISLLKKVKPPFNINLIALNAGLDALKNKFFVQHSFNENRTGLSLFQNASSNWNCDLVSSQANFVCISNTTYLANELFDLFAKEGYIIRDLSSFDLPYSIRITIGNNEDVKHCISILDKLFKKN